MNQPNLPNESTASVKDGICFVIPDGDDIIRSWCSSFNGKEKIFLNDKCVSETRSMKKHIVHEFSNDAGDIYRIEHRVISYFNANVETTAYKNGELLKAFRFSMQKGDAFRLKAYWPFIVITFVGFLVHDFAKLGDWFFFTVIGVGVIVFLATTKRSKPQIEEISEEELLYGKENN